MNQLMWIIAVLGLISLGGAFFRMKRGFGPYNLKIVGIVLIATFASLLALQNTESLTATMGILGAIAGYLFGIGSQKPAKNVNAAKDSTESDGT
ncbi:hypothetical protein ACFLS0_04835 [Candidatus Bipolaricaulota bacterium]